MALVSACASLPRSGCFDGAALACIGVVLGMVGLLDVGSVKAMVPVPSERARDDGRWPF